jgi:adenylate cyclase
MADARVQRRLAAILAADVAGYSRLMGNDEVGTLAALKASHRDVINRKVTEHRGRVVNTPGDSVLIEFASAVDGAESIMVWVTAAEITPGSRRSVQMYSSVMA